MDTCCSCGCLPFFLHDCVLPQRSGEVARLVRQGTRSACLCWHSAAAQLLLWLMLRVAAALVLYIPN